MFGFPWGSPGEYGVDEDDELAGAGDQGLLVGFASADEALVEIDECLVVLEGGGQCGRIEASSGPSPAACDVTAAIMFA